MYSSVGMKLVSSVLRKGNLKQYYQLDIDTSLLKPAEKESWDFVQSFVQKHKALPLLKTIKHELDDLIFPLAEEVPSYYAGQIQERYVSDSISKAYKDTKEWLVKGNIDTAKATEILTEVLVNINMVENRGRILDFRDVATTILKEYKRKKNEGDQATIMLGYPSVDLSSGGLMGDDLVSIVGRPAMGKTFNSLYCAKHAWWEQQKSVMVVSMEMNTIAIAQRMTAMHSHLNLTQLKKAQLSTKNYMKLVAELKGLKSYDAPLWIVDGHMSATVEDIWKMCQQLKPDFLVIDGAYLIRHPNPRLGSFERVAETTRSIKHALCSDLNMPVLCSWQFNREASKKLKKSKKVEVGLEDIGYTDVIGQVSSLVLGLLEDESVETIKRRKITIMKGRNGETGSFYINWDFVNMDFSEIKAMGQLDGEATAEDKAIDAGSYSPQLDIQ